MPAAIAWLLDLGAVALFWVCIGIISLIVFMLVEIVKAVDHAPWPIGGWLAGAVHGAIDPIVAGLTDVQHGLEAGLAESWGFLAESIRLTVRGTHLLGGYLAQALDFLWHHAIIGLVHAITHPIAKVANDALALVNAVPKAIADAEADALAYADRVGTVALRDAEAYAAEIAHTAQHRAEAFANQAVAGLKALEDAAIGEALKLAHEGISAAAEAEQTAVSTAEAYANAAVATAEQSIAAGVGVLEGGLTTVEDQLKALEQAVGAAGLVALIAALPSLLTLVRAIATEAGLGNAECRNKVKNICSVDPSAWEGLLAGLLPLGFLFTLPELVAVARPLIGDLEPLIRQAA